MGDGLITVVVRQGDGFERHLEHVRSLRIECPAASGCSVDVEHNGESVDVIALDPDGTREAVLSFIVDAPAAADRV